MVNKLTHGSNMRWESSRMMLPEHIKALKAYEQEKLKVERPVLDEYERQEIDLVLRDAINNKSLVEISYFKEGFIKKKICYIDKIDPITQQMAIRDTFGIGWKLCFDDIVGVSGDAVDKFVE